MLLLITGFNEGIHSERWVFAVAWLLSRNKSHIRANIWLSLIENGRSNGKLKFVNWKVLNLGRVCKQPLHLYMNVWVHKRVRQELKVENLVSLKK